MISLDNLKTVINAIKCLLTDYPKKKDIPTKLPNPNALTFTGASTASYDGSKDLTLEIPSVPKPLTYEYMPEGYPTKNAQITTLMEKQELAFAHVANGIYGSFLSPPPLALVRGQTYKVNWDGTEYECVALSGGRSYFLGNPSIPGNGDDTGEPFLYDTRENAFATLDTAATHTISVTRIKETVTPMAEEFLPEGVATKSDVEAVQTTAENAQTTAENAQTTAENAQTTAENAQTTAENKFQLMQQNTVTTTVAIGTVSNSGGVVPVKGLNIAVGSTIKFTADNNVSGETVWNGPVKEIYMENDIGDTICLLGLELSLDGETYNFRNKTNASILSNLVIEYEKVIIPKRAYPIRDEGAWLPPYLIANCLYLTKKSTASGATLYRITIDDSGTLTATEVTV